MKINPAFYFIFLIVVVEAFAQSMAYKYSLSPLLKYVVLGTIGYGIIIYLLSRADKTMHFGKVNAIWSAISVLSVALVGQFVFGQKLGRRQWLAFIIISIGLWLSLENGDFFHPNESG